MDAGQYYISSCSRELLDDLKGLFDRLGDFIDRGLLTQLRISTLLGGSASL